MANQRVLHGEEAVAYGHPTKADVINRFVMIEHNEDGTHKGPPLPWTIFIDPFMTPKSNVNWNTISLNALQSKNGYVVSSGVQNDSIAWDVILAAGTWTVEILSVKSTDTGIYSIQFDSVEKGTIDGYNTPTVWNARNSLTGITVAPAAKVELKLKMASKNASSSAYAGAISGVKLIRTA